MLHARIRAAVGWSDARILNISSRGLMINGHLAALHCNEVELWHGERVIVATVIWRKGTRAGLRALTQIPVERIMASSRDASLQLPPAKHWPQLERRRKRRATSDSRLLARAFEFVSVTAIAVLLGFGVFALTEEALARPLGFVQAALES